MRQKVLRGMLVLAVLGIMLGWSLDHELQVAATEDQSESDEEEEEDDDEEEEEDDSYTQELERQRQNTINEINSIKSDINTVEEKIKDLW